MKIVLIMAVAAVVILSIWRYRKRSRRRRKEGLPFVIPSKFTLSPAPLLAEDEVALYNLLRMVVQERYLVFSHVPLCSFIAVDAMKKNQSDVFRHLVLKRVDFALVHPGSCQVEQVVQIERDSADPRQVEYQQVIESVLDAAGIKLTKLQPKKSLSLPDLTARLGVTAEEQ